MTKEPEKTQAELDKAAARKKKADKFWSIFLFTENGKIKSTLVVYTFSLSVLFLAIYIAAFALLTDPLNSLMLKLNPACGVMTEAGMTAKSFAATLVEALVPALLGTALCCSLFFVFKEKKLVPCSYIWILLYALILLIGMLVQLETSEWSGFLTLYAMFVPASVILGGGLSCYLYTRYRREHPDVPVEELPAWKSRKGM